MHKESVVQEVISQKNHRITDRITDSFAQLCTNLWRAFREVLPENRLPSIQEPLVDEGVPEAQPMDLHPSFDLEFIISKHRTLQSHSEPFRSLAIGKQARPEAQFKELPQPPFGSRLILASPS